MKRSTAGLAISALVLAGCSTSEADTPPEKPAASSSSTPSPSARSSSSAGPTQDTSPPGAEQEGRLGVVEKIRSMPGVDGVYLDNKNRATGIVSNDAARKRVIAAGAQAVPANPGEKALLKLQSSIASMPQAAKELGEIDVRLTTQTVGVGVRDPQSAWAKRLATTPHVRVFQSDGGSSD